MPKYEIHAKMSNINNGFVGRADTMEEALRIMKKFHRANYKSELKIENNIGIILYDADEDIWVPEYHVYEV